MKERDLTRPQLSPPPGDADPLRSKHQAALIKLRRSVQAKTALTPHRQTSYLGGIAASFEAQRVPLGHAEGPSDERHRTKSAGLQFAAVPHADEILLPTSRAQQIAPGPPSAQSKRSSQVIAPYAVSTQVAASSTQ
jgi:hypothetical protein